MSTFLRGARAVTRIRRMLARALGMFGRARRDRDIDDEMEAHLALASDEFIRRGMAPGEARRAARLAAGGTEGAKEAYREQRGLPAIETLARDAVFAVRSFRKSPGIATTIVLTLGLSIGATTAMFSVVKAALLDPLPFANSDRLVWTVNRGTRPYDSMSQPDLTDWGRLNDAFEQTGSWVITSVDLVASGAPLHLTSADVTGNFFTMLGAHVALGRSIESDDQGNGKPKVIVLSNALWRTEFGGDRNVIGTGVLLDGTRYTIIGVAGPAFRFPADIDIWRPVEPNPTWVTARAGRVYRGPVALLRRGVTFSEARRKARLVAAQLRLAYPASETGLDYDIQPLREHVVGDSRPLVVVLSGAVGVLLLIACANVATLLLVRATSRSTELGIRIALGASRRRVAAQILVESLMLAAAGVAFGLVAAELAIRFIVSRESSILPLVESVGIDWTVLAFSVAVTVIAGFAAGLAPVLHSTRVDVAQSLRSGGRGSSAGRRSSFARRGLVAVQLVFVVPLLIGGALLFASFERLIHVDPGFRAEHLVRLDLTLPECGTPWYPDPSCAGVQGSRYMTPAAIEGFSETLMRQLRAIPGVQQVAIGHGAPFTEWAFNQSVITVVGQPTPPQDRPNIVELKYATPEYFSTLGVPILRGRSFDANDRRESPPVVIVSAAAAKAYFGGADPIGKQVKDAGTVVGVVGNTKTQTLGAEAEPAMYLAFRQAPTPYLTVLLRSQRDPGAVISAARKVVASVDRNIPVFHAMPLQTAVEASAATQRLAARVVSGFAIAALLLAVLGIHGLVSYTVRDRQRELGIRLALGAASRHIVTIVVGDSLVVASVGIGAGLIVAAIGSRVLGGLLYGVAPTDFLTYALAGVLLLAATVAAAWIPGRRAARVDPLIAMRPE